MPKFQTISENLPLKISSNKGIRPLREIIKEKGKEFFGADTFFLCECYHPDTGHVLGIGKCDYPYCDCITFTQKGLVIEVKVKLIDGFKLEYTGSEEDPNFWVQFEKYLEKIKC